MGSRPGVAKRLGNERHKCQKFEIKIAKESVVLLGSEKMFWSWKQL